MSSLYYRADEELEYIQQISFSSTIFHTCTNAPQHNSMKSLYGHCGSSTVQFSNFEFKTAPLPLTGSLMLNSFKH